MKKELDSWLKIPYNNEDMERVRQVALVKIKQAKQEILINLKERIHQINCDKSCVGNIWDKEINDLLKQLDEK